jgi:hypothetical protein
MSALNGVYVDTDKTIYVRAGDSGRITIGGIPTDENYKVSLGVYNPLTHEIIAETSNHSENEEEVSLGISTDMTETIGAGRYYYAIKLSAQGEEQTVLPKAQLDDDNKLFIPNAPIFVVKPKLVEG